LWLLWDREGGSERARERERERHTHTHTHTEHRTVSMMRTAPGPLMHRSPTAATAIGSALVVVVDTPLPLLCLDLLSGLPPPPPAFLFFGLRSRAMTARFNCSIPPFVILARAGCSCCSFTSPTGNHMVVVLSAALSNWSTASSMVGSIAAMLSPAFNCHNPAETITRSGHDFFCSHVSLTSPLCV
jgi:hypothetical protein